VFVSSNSYLGANAPERQYVRSSRRISLLRKRGARGSDGFVPTVGLICSGGGYGLHQTLMLRGGFEPSSIGTFVAYTELRLTRLLMNTVELQRRDLLRWIASAQADPIARNLTYERETKWRKQTWSEASNDGNMKAEEYCTPNTSSIGNVSREISRPTPGISWC